VKSEKTVNSLCLIVLFFFFLNFKFYCNSICTWNFVFFNCYYVRLFVFIFFSLSLSLFFILYAFFNIFVSHFHQNIETLSYYSELIKVSDEKTFKNWKYITKKEKRKEKEGESIIKKILNYIYFRNNKNTSVKKNKKDSFFQISTQ
jgi:hypothetical protein